MLQAKKSIILIAIATPLAMRSWALDSETIRMVVILVLVHNLFSSLVFPFAGPLSNGLRATGDVRYTMIVSVASTIGARLIFSLMFSMGFGWGVFGIAYAMCLDWVIRAILFYYRLRSGAWKRFQVI